MQNFVQSGEVITVTAPAAVSSGDMVVVGSVHGVAQADAASGALVEIVRRGVFTLPKVSAQAWTAGAKVYWHPTNENLTTTASGAVLVGFATAAAANPSDTGTAYLDGVVR